MMWEDEDLLTDAERRRPSRVVERVVMWGGVAAFWIAGSVYVRHNSVPLWVVLPSAVCGVVAGLLRLLWPEEELGTTVAAGAMLFGVVLAPAYESRLASAHTIPIWLPLAVTTAAAAPFVAVATIRARRARRGLRPAPVRTSEIDQSP